MMILAGFILSAVIGTAGLCLISWGVVVSFFLKGRKILKGFFISVVGIGLSLLGYCLYDVFDTYKI
jgi:hypothetical protein